MSEADMYGLEDNVDTSFLSDVRLQQVCVGENEVILHLENEISIMIASTIRFSPAGDPMGEYEDARDGGQILLPLLGHKVEDATGQANGTLQLRWDTGDVLEILDSWKEFESYTINHSGGTIVV